jgi:diphthamide synthase subunit DPH2
MCLAILICLEHSFWLTQQGSNPTKAFTKALDTYLEDKCIVVDQRLEDYLMSKRSGDWFAIKHCPSYDECTEFQKIVLDNLLRKASLYSFLSLCC